MWLKKCNQSGIHWNKSKANRLVENLLFASSKFDCWHKAQVSMSTNIYRQTSNSEEQLLSKKMAKETFKTFRGLRRKHPKNVFLGTFHVSLLWNRFESLNELIKDTFDVLMNFRYLATALFEKIETKMEGEYFSTLKKKYLLKSSNVNKYL